MSKTVRQYSIWLDVMRGIAALVVFLGHARVVLLTSVVGALGVANAAVGGSTVETGKFIPKMEMTDWGHEAVIVFFVLSGYLVGGGALRAYTSGRWSTSNYAIARLSRLWTVLIPALLLTAILDHIGVAMAGPGSIYTGPPGQQMVWPDQLSRMTFEAFLGNLFFVQRILTPVFGSDSPLWSLSYEFWFYVAFPFLMFLFAPAVHAGKRAIYLVLLLGIGLFVGPRIALYFLFWLFGAAVQLLPKRLEQRTAFYLAVGGSIAFVILLVALYKARIHIFAADAVESIACSALLYVIVHLQNERPRSWFVAGASFVAAFSYTLYLVHAPIMAFLTNLMMPVWKPWPVSPLAFGKYLGVCSFVIIIAIGLYWLFERNTPIVRRWMTSIWVRLTNSGAARSSERAAR